MTADIRVLDTSLAPARWNVAMTAALVQRHAAGLAPDTIRFHRYPACVLIGHGQQLAVAADVEHCRRLGIEIARRVTGGGAVYMSPRMLAFDVVLNCAAIGGGLDRLTSAVCEAVAAGIGALGVSATFDAPSAIAAAGAKISGTSGYMEGRSAVLQGTLLIEDDVAEMAAALRLPADALRTRVTGLADVLGRVRPLPGCRRRCLAGCWRARSTSAARRARCVRTCCC